MARMKWVIGVLLSLSMTWALPGFSQTTNAPTVRDLQQEVQQLREQLRQMRQELDAMRGASAPTAPTPAPASAQVQPTPEAASPTTLHMGGVTLTPGGFVAANGFYRSHMMNTDVGSTFGAIPVAASINSKTSEFGFSAAQSRLSLAINTAMHGTKALGYFELDFLGNSGYQYLSSSSVQPRLRLAFLNLDAPHGISISGGQNWSLLQTNRKGITPLTEAIPLTIDESYVVGYSNARQAGMRVVKSIGPKMWAAFAAEGSSTAASSFCELTGVENDYCNYGRGSTTGSYTLVPDLIAKVAFEPGWGHYEFKALGRFFRERIYPNAFTSNTITNINNNTSTTTSTSTSYYYERASAEGAFNTTQVGSGLGLGAILPVVRNKMDITFQALGGRGIGHYGTAGGPDVTYRPDGKAIPVLGYQAVLGIETHPTPKFDFYVYGGTEYYKRTAFYDAVSPFGAIYDFNPYYYPALVTPGLATGYGSPFLHDEGCFTEQAYGACSSDSQNRSIWEVTPGFWYRFWKGSAGSLQMGASYSYVSRKAWAGIGGAPEANQNTVMTSFRYYLP